MIMIIMIMMMRGFFKGMLYPVITAGAINSVFFGVYGVCMDKMKVKCYQLHIQMARLCK